MLGVVLLCKRCFEQLINPSTEKLIAFWKLPVQIECKRNSRHIDLRYIHYQAKHPACRSSDRSLKWSPSRMRFNNWASNSIQEFLKTIRFPRVPQCIRLRGLENKLKIDLSETMFFLPQTTRLKSEYPATRLAGSGSQTFHAMPTSLANKTVLHIFNKEHR